MAPRLVPVSATEQTQTPAAPGADTTARAPDGRPRRPEPPRSGAPGWHIQNDLLGLVCLRNGSGTASALFVMCTTPCSSIHR